MTESTKCECCGVAPGLLQLPHNSALYTWSAELGGVWANADCMLRHGFDAFAERVRARRSQVAEPQFCGTQTEVLPETLPAGTRSVDDVNGYIYTAANVVALTESMVYFGTWDWVGRGHRGGMTGGIHPAHIDWSSVPIQEAKPVAVEPEKHIDLRTVDGFLKHLVANPLAHEPATCRDCSAPATHGEHCVYCANRHGSDATPRRLTAAQLLARQEAMERRLRAEAREKPRPTKASREMAKPHPWRSWSTSGDES